MNTQKINFSKHVGIGKNKFVTNEQVSHSTVIAAANMRSKSQKKKDLFANLIAEAQDSFAKHNNPPQAAMTLQQTESHKIKKMHSQSNLHPVQNKTIASTAVATASGKSDPKNKRLIF